MAILITLPEETERLLRQRAAERGQDVTEYARVILERDIQGMNGVSHLPPEKLTFEQWDAELCAWQARIQGRTAIADDSRESFYEGRGE